MSALGREPSRRQDRFRQKAAVRNLPVWALALHFKSSTQVGLESRSARPLLETGGGVERTRSTPAELLVKERSSSLVRVA